jgi:hypothetical protein
MKQLRDKIIIFSIVLFILFLVDKLDKKLFPEIGGTITNPLQQEVDYYKLNQCKNDNET